MTQALIIGAATSGCSRCAGRSRTASGAGPALSKVAWGRRSGSTTAATVSGGGLTATGQGAWGSAHGPVSRCAGAHAVTVSGGAVHRHPSHGVRERMRPLFQVFRGAYDRCLRGCECVRHPFPDVRERLRPRFKVCVCIRHPSDGGVNAATAVSRCAEAHTADISRFGSAHGSPCAPAGPPARTGRSSRWRWRADAPPPSLPDQPDQIGVTVTVTVGVAVASTVGVTPICSRSISCSGLTLVFCLAVGSLTSRE